MMTEQEWLACTDPIKTWQVLHQVSGHGFSERKHRLFACACCRSYWTSKTPTFVRDAVNSSEQAADGLLGWVKLGQAERRVRLLAGNRRDRVSALAELVLHPHGGET